MFRSLKHSNRQPGVESNLEQSNTIAIGDSALYHSNGSGNVATGSKSLYSNTTGAANSAFGSQSLYLNTTGINNTAVGYHAGIQLPLAVPIQLLVMVQI